MKVILTKNIQLLSAVVYMRIRRQEERKDIQDYLKGLKSYNTLIENRIKDYLKNIGIYDEKYQLTKLGNTVKETGKIFVSEEGKYHIWFTKGDSHFGSKIFYFRRIQPNIKDEVKDSINLDEDGFLLPTDETRYSEIKLIKVKVFGKVLNDNNSIQFSWVWDNLEKSYYAFSGQFIKHEKKINILNEPIPCYIDISKKIIDILPEWSSEHNRYRVRFDEINEEYKRIFEYKNYNSKYKDFNVNIQNLPLMPYNKEEAKKWRDWLLIEEIKKDYFIETDFENAAKELNEKEALAPFNLEIPKIKDIINKTNDKRVFWHLQAPIDLNPNKKIMLSYQPVELRQGENISFTNIIAKLGLYNCIMVIYLDRYVITERQQTAVSALLKAINSKKKIVLTDIPSINNNFSDFIYKNEKTVRLSDYRTIFKAKPPHDRYLVAITEDGIKVWNISNSIDYIYFSESSINENTVGTIRQSVVFTPINSDMLNQDILHFINRELKNGN